MSLTIYTDGASRGNPGPASYGFIITSNGKKVYEEGKYLGITTNNFAEYSAVLKSLEYLTTHLENLERVELNFLMDSKLVVEQLSGRFKIKSQSLKPLIEKIKGYSARFKSVNFTHIPRSKNKIADQLANFALDNR